MVDKLSETAWWTYFDDKRREKKSSKLWSVFDIHLPSTLLLTADI